MAGAKDVTVRALTLDGQWAMIGSDRVRGVWPENVSLESDLWGSSRASFNLRRDAAAFFPDIGAFTPIEVEVGSKLVWSGRVQQTPSQVAQRVINVQCEGWQYHLDDDLFQRTYVHDRLADWRDTRTFPGADLATSHLPHLTVITGDGGITFGCAAGISFTTLRGAGVTLDFGPNGPYAKRAVASFVRGSGAPGSVGVRLYIRAHSSFAGGFFGGGTIDDFVSAFNPDTISQNPATPTIVAGSGTVGLRYLSVFLYNSGATYTAGLEDVLTMTDIKVFTDTAYESGNASILKASDVVADALTRGTMLLSTDRSGIQATSFSLPEYAPSGPQTPRQAWSSVNAYHDWLSQIDVQRRPIFAPKPTRPLFEIGAWSAIDDEDASANSGDEIYNRTLVTAQSPDGQPISVERTITGTLVDRRGFRRTMQLPVNSALPTGSNAAANQIGDLWLAAHQTTPFKGSVTITGDQSVRHIMSGSDIGLEDLLLNTGQLLRFSDRSDPDTGGHGRDCRIASVSYTPASNTAQITLDNSRTSLPALLARLAIIQGG
jgi:hypothetical protein